MKRHHGGQEEQSCWCSGFDLRVLCILLRKCDRLLTPRTCQAAIAPTTMNAKAAKVAKLSTTCNRESRDQVSRGSGRRRRREPPVSVGRLRRPPVAGRNRGSLRDLCGLCVHPFCTR